MSFPDLTAKLRLDTSETVTALAGATEGVKAFTDSGIERMGLLSEAMRHVSESMVKVGAAGAAVSEGGGIGGLLGSVGGSVPVIGAALAGVGALFGGIEHLANVTDQYSVSILQNADHLGISTQLMQSLTQATALQGMSQDDLTKVLAKFEVNLVSGDSALNKYGLSLKQLGIDSKDPTVALQEFATWLQTTNDASIRNAASIALLGKGNQALSDTLHLVDLPQFTAELSSMGVILTDAQLKTNALAEASRQELGVALKGLEYQVGSALSPALTEMFQVLTAGVAGGKGAITSLAGDIATIVGDIASFIGGMEGQTKAQLEAAAAAPDPLKSLVEAQQASTLSTDQAALSAANDAEMIKQLTRATTVQTQALDDQVAKLQDQQTAYDANIQKQIQGQHDLVTALDAQIATQTALQKLADDNGTSQLAQLKAQLAAVQTSTDGQRKAGESVADFQKRIKEQDLQTQITAEENKRQLATDTTAAQKNTLTDATTAVITNLTAQQKAFDDGTKAKLAGLNQQKADLQRHLQDEQAMVQANADAASTTIAQLTQQVKNDQAAMTAGAPAPALAFTDSWVTAGAKLDVWFKNFWSDPGGSLLSAATTLATTIGEAVGSALASSVGVGARNYINQHPEDAAIAGALFGAKFGLPGAVIGTVVGLGGAAISQRTAGGVQSTDQLNELTATLNQVNALMAGPDPKTKAVQAQIDWLEQRVWTLTGGTGAPPFTYPGVTPVEPTATLGVPRAAGGPISAGMDYLVGERGPELFRSSSSGTIVPNSQLGGGGDQHFHFTINGAPQMTAEELMREAAWTMKVQ